MLNSIQKLLATLFFLTGIGLQAARSSEDALTIELEALAQDFAAIIEKKGGGPVAIGEFSASSEVKASIGPRIQLVLAEQFLALKVMVDSENYRFEVKGDYQPYIDRESGLLGVKLIGRLIDRDTAEPLAEKPTGRFVFGAETVPMMLGLNTRTSPNANPLELSHEFERARKNPNADIQQTLIRAEHDSPFSVEILVKSGTGYKPRSIETDAKGRPLVPIKNSEVYGVRLHNNAPFEAAVELQIDGINCFSFSEQKLKYWILAPGKTVDVIGWHKNDQKSLEFKVVDFPETAAAKLHFKPSSSIGLITTSFSASWSDESERPTDEPKLSSRGTGFGAEIDFKTSKVTRTIGQTRSTISVRYER